MNTIPELPQTAIEGPWGSGVGTESIASLWRGIGAIKIERCSHLSHASRRSIMDCILEDRLRLGLRRWHVLA